MPRMQPTDLSIAIGMRIEKERKRIGWTREQLAEKIDVTPGFITDLERGRTGLTISRMVDLCHIFNCSADYIIFGVVSSSTISYRIENLPQEYKIMIDDIVSKQVHMLQSALRNE